MAGLPYTGAELVYAAREEMACTLDDVLGRRTRADDPACPGGHGCRPGGGRAGRRRAGLGRQAAAADQVAQFIDGRDTRSC